MRAFVGSVQRFRAIATAIIEATKRGDAGSPARQSDESNMDSLLLRNSADMDAFMEQADGALAAGDDLVNAAAEAARKARLAAVRQTASGSL